MPDCSIEGDSDLYGLGVRLSLYLTGAAAIIARLIAPSRTATLSSSLYVLTFALTITLIKNVYQGRPAMLEMYLIATMTTLIRAVLTLGRGAPSGVASTVAAIVTGITQVGVIMWVVYAHRWTGIPPEGVCGRYVRFFGVVDVTGPFGTFLGVIPVIVLFVLIFVWVGGCAVVWRAGRKLHGEADSASESTFLRGGGRRWGMGALMRRVTTDGLTEWLEMMVNAMKGIDEYKPIRKVHLEMNGGDSSELFSLLLTLALSVWFTEDTLKVSGVTVDADMSSTGQLLPLIVGIVSVTSVLAGWINDRLLNAAGERMMKMGEQTEMRRYGDRVSGAA